MIALIAEEENREHRVLRAAVALAMVLLASNKVSNVIFQTVSDHLTRGDNVERACVCVNAHHVDFFFLCLCSRDH